MTCNQIQFLNFPQVRTSSVGVLPDGVEGVLALVRTISFNVNGTTLSALQIKERTAVVMGEPADIASFVGYIASPEYRFVTGG